MINPLSVVSNGYLYPYTKKSLSVSVDGYLIEQDIPPNPPSPSGGGGGTGVGGAIFRTPLDLYREEELRLIKVDDEIDVDHLQLPPMIIQPFIENALKHGLLHKKGDKNLSIEFKLVHDVLICEIIDNGVGRKRSEEIKMRNTKTHKSFATEATDKRMDLLNSFNDKHYSFDIIDLYEDDKSLGTKVIIISIPI